MPDLLVITGPTATGKTALGIELALALDGEVVSADSMQVYKGMDIGTAKPTLAERQNVPHWMLDVAEPWEQFSAARYSDMAAACVEDIKNRGKLPIVVGGTGLYIDGLLRGTNYAAAPSDMTLRRKLEAEYDRMGGEAFQEKLSSVDPERAKRLHARDKKRLVRAYEIYTLTGHTITEHDRLSRLTPPRYTAATIALDYEERDNLYRRINTRAVQMFQDGLVEEVKKLLQLGLDDSVTAMQAIGYKETAEHIAGHITLEQAIEKVCLRSRQYAKRQLTWLRGRDDIHWIRWKKEPNIQLARQISTEILDCSAVK